MTISSLFNNKENRLHSLSGWCVTTHEQTHHKIREMQK